MQDHPQLFILEPLLSIKLLESLPAYRSASFKYSLKIFLPKLVAKTEGQLERLQQNLTKLKDYPFVSELFLDEKISVSKLCGATDKFKKTCEKIQSTVKHKTKTKSVQESPSLKQLL